MRDFILQKIRRLASANGGQAPGQKLFAKETGIAGHQWRGRFWARWGDRLTEAGLKPSDRTGKLPEESNDALQRQPVSNSVEGFVYLIKSGDFYKIGRSDDAERRFN